MQRKVYHLKTCDTSRRIIKQMGDLLKGFEFQEIKEQPITARQLEEMKALAGSYEALFSRRAKKYKEMGLKDQNLTEDDYKYYLMQEYTFLKRPVIIVDNDIFIGSSKKNIAALQEKLENL
jgi:arsenate reductase